MRAAGCSTGRTWTRWRWLRFRLSATRGEAVVSTTGGSSAALAELRRPGSLLLGTYSFFPELWGNDVFDLAERMLAGEAVPGRSSPRQQMFVTAANVAQFETPGIGSFDRQARQHRLRAASHGRLAPTRLRFNLPAELAPF